MFCQNDAWFMNESLAFYQSTNTFSNPAFDNGSEREYEQSKDEEEEKKKQDQKSWLASKQKGSQQKLKPSFCNNLAFSIESKIYVLELNFKRRLQHLRSFADKHLAWMFSSRQTKRSFASRSQSFGWHSDAQASWKISDKYADEKFWRRETFFEPKSRESLGKQQQKILCRLEHFKRSVSQQQFESNRPGINDDDPSSSNEDCERSIHFINGSGSILSSSGSQSRGSRRSNSNSMLSCKVNKECYAPKVSSSWQNKCPCVCGCTRMCVWWNAHMMIYMRVFVINFVCVLYNTWIRAARVHASSWEQYAKQSGLTYTTSNVVSMQSNELRHVERPS